MADPCMIVFSLCFDFLRQVPLGTERNYHIQTFPELENYRRDHVLSWKWDPFGSEPKETSVSPVMFPSMRAC